MSMPIEGTCDPRFSRVRDVFADNFAHRGELGAAVAITLDGHLVVDLWGGHVDKARTKPWTENTLVNVFSTTKGITAIAALRLVDRGLLDLDAPVATYWPEFAQAGKEHLRVRELLNHTAGLPSIDRELPPEAIFDWGAMTDALAAQAPYWPHGTRHGYHAVTFGWLVGELVRRISGQRFGAFVQREIAAPLEAAFYIGVPPGLESRVSDMRGGAPPAPGERNVFAEIMQTPDSLLAKAFVRPTPITTAIVNGRPYREAEIPAANGHATARAVARIYTALACGEHAGTRLLSPEMIARARTEEASGDDLVLGERTRFGLGFMLPQPHARFGPAEGAFGHPGAGGSVGFADPEARVGFGYVMNRMGSNLLVDPRPGLLTDAFYASL